jgi:hypothetical protein
MHVETSMIYTIEQTYKFTLMKQARAVSRRERAACVRMGGGCICWSQKLEVHAAIRTEDEDEESRVPLMHASMCG